MSGTADIVHETLVEMSRKERGAYVPYEEPSDGSEVDETSN